MKRFLPLLILTLFTTVIFSQVNRADILQNLETRNNSVQEKVLTATLKQASRLFGSKDDLTSVIVVLPAGTTVTVTGSDEDYYRIRFENDEGYILKRHAELEMTPEENLAAKKKPVVQKKEEEPAREMTRFEYLEKKYGTRLAAQINAGKIWKGMTSQMVLDSWGKPQKINRSITGSYAREEWIYRNTWLFIENNTLIDWGPIRK
ncbi:MAG: hypothetical protein ACUVTX_12575 [Bacteroidales bacterium]